MKRPLAALTVLLSVTLLAGCKKQEATAKDAKEMLSAFTKAGADEKALFAALRPKPEDYEAVFVGDAVARAKAGMEPLWDNAVKGFNRAPEQTEIEVAGAAPAQLAKHEGTAAMCPGGYKNIADKLNPKIVVYCFRFTKPGEQRGTLGDALVHVNGHWAYFPKPFRYLNPAMPLPTASTSGAPSAAPSGAPSAAP